MEAESKYLAMLYCYCYYLFACSCKYIVAKSQLDISISMNTHNDSLFVRRETIQHNMNYNIVFTQ